MLLPLASLCLYSFIAITSPAISAQQIDLFSLLPPTEPGLPSIGDLTSGPRVNTTTPLYASKPDVQCWPTNVPGHPVSLRPVVVSDYFQAVHKRMVQDDAMIPRLWDLGRDGIIQYVENEARVALKVPWPPSQQAFQPIIIAHMAALIADKCLREETGYFGGRVYLYPGKSDFRVVVASPTDPSASKSTVSIPTIA